MSRPRSSWLTRRTVLASSVRAISDENHRVAGCPSMNAPSAHHVACANSSSLPFVKCRGWAGQVRDTLTTSHLRITGLLALAEELDKMTNSHPKGNSSAPTDSMISLSRVANERFDIIRPWFDNPNPALSSEFCGHRGEFSEHCALTGHQMKGR